MAASVLSIVIFIAILSANIYGDDTFDCTDHKDDSFHPMKDSLDCRHYWHCIYVGTSYMHSVKRTCPAGTKFDAELNECEISSTVKCRPTGTTRTPRISTTRQFLSRIRPITIKTNLATNVDKSTRVHNKLQNLIVLATTTATRKKLINPLEQLLKRLNAIAIHSTYQSVFYTVKPTILNKINRTSVLHWTTLQTTTSYSQAIAPKILRIHRNHRRHRRRHNLTLSVLTSNDHKIRQFFLNRTHGIIVQCNEIRRRQLRDLVFHTTKSTTRTWKPLNSSLRTFHYDILSLIIFIDSFLFLQKISN